MYIQKDRLLFLLCFFMIIILISCVKEKKQDIISLISRGLSPR